MYEDIQSDSELILQKIFQFLGVDPAYKSPAFEKKINVSHSYRIPQLNNFIKSTSRLIRSVVGDQVAENIKKTGVLVPIENLNNVSSNISITPPFSEDDRKRLYDIFDKEIEILAILIDRDLSHWN